MKICELEKPADYSFQHFGLLREAKPDNVQTVRIGAPHRGSKNKLQTHSIWLDNNRLKSIRYLDIFVESVLEEPSLLSWIDLSFNKLTEIDNSILKFPHLKIIYLHGNRIADPREVLKLKTVKDLRTLTLHGNPLYAKKNYRQYVIGALPQIIKLDFSMVTRPEKVEAVVNEKRIES